MSKMHIADQVTSWLHQKKVLTGWALCGARLAEKNGAQPGAPYCPKCLKRSGWNR